MDNPLISRLSSQAGVQAGSKPISLREGQMFHGQVKQLYPGQMAEVKIGGTTMMAKLEVPMKAGDSYYFQVKSTEPELQLKIITGPMQPDAGPSKQLANLLETLQLPKTAEMQSIVALVMKERIPVSKDQLLASAALLSKTPAEDRPQALSAIRKLLEMKLPLTEMNFRSILGVETKEGLHALLSALRGELQSDGSLPVHMKEAILQTIQGATGQTEAMVGKTILNEAVLKMLEPGTPVEMKFQFLQLLKEGGILPQRTSIANLQSVLASLAAENVPGRTAEGSLEKGQQMPAMQAKGTGEVQPAINSQPQTVPSAGQSASINEMASGQPAARTSPEETIMRTLGEIFGKTANLESTLRTLQEAVAAERTFPAEVKEQVQQMIVRLSESLPKEPFNDQRMLQLSSTLIRHIAASQLQLPPGAAADPVVRMLGGDDLKERLPDLANLAAQSEKPAIKEAALLSSAKAADAVDGTFIKETVRFIIKSFGFHYEAGITGKGAEPENLSQTLKPQLLALLSEAAVPPGIRDLAEAAVARLNGPSLLSGDTGMNQQLVMQVPLELFGKKIDATLQWNGRMKEDDKIDPDYARVLFYLDLEKLKSTIVDMQVQNKVVTVTVFNEHEALSVIGLPLQSRLKEGLLSAGYQLSGVFFKPIEERLPTTQSKPKRFQDGNGVDFRI